MSAAFTRVYPSVATQSIPNATWTALTFGLERQDDNGMWVIGAPTRLTVPAGKAGIYLVAGTATFAANGTGIRGIGLAIGGVGGLFWALDDSYAGNAVNGNNLSICAPLSLAVGEFVELGVYQSSGAALNHVTGAGYGGELAAALLT